MWLTQKCVFQFNGEFYEQLDGIPMGSLIAPLLADVCMNWLINESTKFDTQSQLFYRYVNNYFAVFSTKQKVKKFYNSLNQVYQNLQFTLELEQTNQLPFLDVLIPKADSNSLQLTFYCKSQHTGLYTKWTSFVSIQYKINLINYLLHRAYQICNSY